MDVVVLSGEDTQSLDKHYLLYRNKFSAVEIIDNLDKAFLQNKLSSMGFFTEHKLYVFRNVFLKQVKVGKVSKHLQESLSYITSLNDLFLLFIETDSNKIKYYKQYFPKAIYKDFKIPPSLFNFLDHFAPRTVKQCYGDWIKAKNKNAPELLLFMLRRRLRELLSIKCGELKGNIVPWQLGKLKAQAALWEERKLSLIYRALYQYEKGLKSGLNPLSTEQALDTIIALYL